MNALADYIIAHTVRGECQCGRRIDKGNAPDPTGHTADLYFFKVALKDNPDAETLRKLALAHRSEGRYVEQVNPFDGKEHNYIALGGWIGDQGLALQFMGLCTLLGMCELLTPNILPIPDDLKERMAGMGLIAIQTRLQ